MTRSQQVFLVGCCVLLGCNSKEGADRNTVPAAELTESFMGHWTSDAIEPDK